MKRISINPKKILVIQTAFIGDAILTSPMIRGVAEIFPNAQIDLLAIPQTKIIFENNKLLTNIILFNKRDKKKRTKSFWNCIFSIRKEKYDLGISIQSSLTSSLLMYLGNIKIRHGFSRQKLLNMSVEHGIVKGAHKIQKILRLLEPLSNQKFSEQTSISFSGNEKKKVEKFLEMSKSKRKIAVAPSSVWFTKRWPKEYFKILLKKLSNENIDVFLLGGSGDVPLCNELTLSENIFNTAGKLNLLESAKLIKNCDLILTNDSAPLHLANAVKTDVLAIFGPTVKSLGFYPFRESDEIIEVDLPCRPCGTHGGNKCPQNHFDCMNKITPEIVFNKILHKLEGE